MRNCRCRPTLSPAAPARNCQRFRPKSSFCRASFQVPVCYPRPTHVITVVLDSEHFMAPRVVLFPYFSEIRNCLTFRRLLSCRRPSSSHTMCGSAGGQPINQSTQSLACCSQKPFSVRRSEPDWEGCWTVAAAEGCHGGQVLRTSIGFSSSSP